MSLYHYINVKLHILIMQSNSVLIYSINLALLYVTHWELTTLLKEHNKAVPTQYIVDIKSNLVYI